MSRSARFALTCAALVGGLAAVPLASVVVAQSSSPSSTQSIAAQVVVPVVGVHSPTAPTDLRVESVEHPLGLDVAKPRFSWKVTDADRGDVQSAYRVRVAVSVTALAAGTLVWDSGRVTSADMTQVAYAGPALASRSRYVWDAETWDSTGRSSTRSQSWFEMGLLAPSDWTAKFITTPFGYARTIFDTTPARTVASARVYVAAYLPLSVVKDHTDGTVNTFGAYYLWLNGAKVTPDLFEPNWTVSTKQVLYRTYDATSLVVGGHNVIGLAMSRPNVMVQLEITYDDGSRSTVTSGNNWRTSAGPVTSSNFLTQEVYDARLEQSAWQSPTFDDSTWRLATTAPGAGPLVSAAAYPPVRVSSVVTPTTIESLGGGSYMIDLGQNYAAMPRITVDGAAGQTLSVSYGEDWNSTTKVLSRTMAQFDRFTMRAGLQTLELQYSYRGFRYMRIDGWPSSSMAPNASSVVALAVNTVLPDAITFSSSNLLYNRIHEMAKRTLMNNAHGHPEDCPHREKGGWGADANAASAAMLYDFDASGFYTKWLNDIRLAQADDGSVHSVNGMYTGQDNWDDPAWGTVYPMLTWNTYRTYGDQRLLQSNFDGIKRFVDDLASKATDNIVDHPDYSWGQDWAAMQITDAKLFDTAYLYIDTNIVADMATILGNTSDASAYRARAASIKASFNASFYSLVDHEYSSGNVHSQASNAIPLVAGLVPDDQRAAVVATLRAQVAAGKGYEQPWQPAAAPGILTGGVVGSQFIGRALASNGLSDVVGAFFQSTQVGSFGDMLTNGPGTVWEYAAPWDDILSKDHPALAGQTAWLYESLAGIQQSPTSVAFESLVIDPQHQPGITFVNATKQTPHGDVVSNWKTNSAGFAFVHEVGIPFDSSGVVRVSTAGLANGQIIEGGTVIYANGVFTPVEGITNAVAGAGYVDFTVGSGHYVFKTSEVPAGSVRTVLDGDDGRFTYSAFTRYPLQYTSINSTLQSGRSGSTAAFVCEQCLMMQWVAPVGPERGTAKVRVDGGAWTNVDLYAPASAFQQIVWTSSVLTRGAHTVEIQSTGRNPASLASVVEIDAMAVYSDLPLPPRTPTIRTVIDSDDARWVYTGFKRYAGSTSWVNQTIESGVTGSTASYRCVSCTKLELILAKGPDRGIAQVRVDGGPWTSVDLYAPAPLYQQNLWTSGTVPVGAHTVEIEGVGRNPLSGASVIEIDAITLSS